MLIKKNKHLGENISQKAHIGKNLSLILQQEKLIRKKNPKRKTERQIKNQSKIKNKFILETKGNEPLKSLYKISDDP